MSSPSRVAATHSFSTRPYTCRLFFLIALACCRTALPATAYAEVTILGLDSLFAEAGDIELKAMSADGTVLTGTNSTLQLVDFQIPFPGATNWTVYESFKWTADTGAEPLATPNPYFAYRVHDMSADGTMSVGSSDRVGIPPDRNPFVIDGLVAFNGQTSAIGHLPYIGDRDLTTLDFTELTTISADGRVAAGYSDDRWHAEHGHIARPIVWNSETGITPLNVPEQLWPQFSSGVDSKALWVDSNGAMIIGKATRVTGEWQDLGYWIWHNESQQASLAADFLGLAVDQIHDVSRDGRQIIVENSDGIFLWSKEESHEIDTGLGRSLRFGNNGETLFGKSSGADGYSWNSIDGLRDIRAYLTDEFQLADELSDWTELSAVHLSDDGRTIAGTGFNTSGIQDAWVIRNVPEPSSASALILVSISLLHWRHRKSASICAT